MAPTSKVTRSSETLSLCIKPKLSSHGFRLFQLRGKTTIQYFNLKDIIVQDPFPSHAQKALIHLQSLTMLFALNVKE